MNEIDLAVIGDVLHAGHWRIQSFTPRMAEQFISQLEERGFYILDKETLTQIDSITSLVGYRGLDKQSREDLIDISKTVRKLYDPRR